MSWRITRGQLHGLNFCGASGFFSGMSFALRKHESEYQKQYLQTGLFSSGKFI